MKVGDLVKVHLRTDLEWRETIGVFMGYQKDSNKARTHIFAEGEKHLFMTMDVYDIVTGHPANGILKY